MRDEEAVPPSDGSDGEWWRSYFDDAFADRYRPLLPEEETREEVGAVIEALGLARGDRVLDLACGWGRHARALAGAGFRVTGLDRSEALLRMAAEAPRPRSGGASWVRADVREIPFRGAFDAVVSLFSSLGYLDDQADLAALRGVREALRPGGSFLLEVMHRDHLAREFVERDWWEEPDGTVVRVEREFDAVEGVSRERLRWSGPGGAGEKRHRIRVRSATEWRALLDAAGLRREAWYGGWDLSPFDHRSERLIVVARPGS